MNDQRDEAMFIEFPKIARLTRECFITEKIDGTNACVAIDDDGTIRFGSRTKWITPDDDNHGFARWATDNREELLKLGPGRHFGEWWGNGIQRGYGLPKGEKRFSLFNVARWSQEKPACCDVVPTLFHGMFSTVDVLVALDALQKHGSVAAPGFAKPEGVIIYHVAANLYFKKTIERDTEWKGKQT